MIGSFWNLCRACPSMPVDKLHSEYRSTYRWHEYTGPRQEVVRRPPQPNAAPNAGDTQHSSKEDEVHNELPKLEPAMPRRKKYPDLAYRHHEFLISDGEITANGVCNTEPRARSEERGAHWRPSRRSKSEGPRGGGGHGDGMRERERRRESDPDLENMGRETGLLRKAISKISTEYRLQFAWPQGHTSRRDAVDSSAPRKSQSMGALKPATNAMVHKKRIDLENKDASELEPLVDERNTREDKTHIFKDEFNSEYKKNFRPFSQYEYSEGRFTKRGAPVDDTDNSAGQNSLPPQCEKNDSWYREVVELRKKAGEYKHRGWGSELAPDRLSDIYNKQVELWDQVSRRSSLSALSLASMTHKSYTKEEKEVDNNNKTSPSKAARNAENSARIVRDMIRHHLERTTGGSEFDGLILSPTREKLEPTIPRKDDDSRSSQKNSPKKHSPMKSSSLKRHNQKAPKSGPKNLRSQSVGPVTDTTEKRSPKRQSRSATVKERKSSANQASIKRPRPSSLNTTVSSRSKHSSVPSKTEDDRLAKANSKSNTKQKLGTKQLEKGNSGADPPKTEANEEVKNAPVEAPEIIDYEPVVKSPPEPTRVKSPEQILMRSPDPVNWTVPLDTGKTFTVTQNVREGDMSSRPHSEVKAWTPPDVPLPIAQSAPPTLDQNKEQGMDLAVKA
ncbi:nuclear protein MDM1 isoform X1 [Tribolium castaneum]|uniref:nuclear protein MDM1 isoform X1 n=1 Tax=Tribolium castaneum TaxID=7070 RepID=UPI00046C050C|nr:PREDICTED: nuclear protein MDM1 isoform X1 [Tribolium castaneum]|eukprot:XP_008199653.1 PREDICTED: nuclear protein MDM1 isoform X1 [Tribolium castaneum]